MRRYRTLLTLLCLASPLLAQVPEVDRTLLANIRKALAAREDLMRTVHVTLRITGKEWKKDEARSLAYDVRLDHDHPRFRARRITGSSGQKGENTEDVVFCDGERVWRSRGDSERVAEWTPKSVLHYYAPDLAFEYVATHGGSPISSYLPTARILSCHRDGDGMTHIKTRERNGFRFAFTFDEAKQHFPVRRQSLIRLPGTKTWVPYLTIEIQGGREVGGFWLPTRATLVEQMASVEQGVQKVRELTVSAEDWAFGISLDLPDRTESKGRLYDEVRSTVLPPREPVEKREQALRRRAERAKALTSELKDGNAATSVLRSQDIPHPPTHRRWSAIGLAAGALLALLSLFGKLRTPWHVGVLVGAVALGGVGLMGVLTKAPHTTTSWQDLPLPYEAGFEYFCGPECVFASAAVLGSDVTYQQVLESTAFDPRKGTTLRALYIAADRLKIPFSPPRHEEQLPDRYPSLLHLTSSHYVVLLGRRDGICVVFDPQREPMLIAESTLWNHCSGWTLTADEETQR